MFELMEFGSDTCRTGSRGRGFGGNNYYPSPYLDYTGTSVPRNFGDLIDWSEFAYLTSDIRELFRRLFSYFLTPVLIDSLDTDQQTVDSTDQDNWKRVLEKQLGWHAFLHAIFEDIGAYGNCFWSVIAKHERFLQCNNCGRWMHLTEFAKLPGSDFAYRGGQFVGRCQSMRCRGDNRGVAPMRVEDFRKPQAKNLIFKRWPVREMSMHHYQYTGENEYFWTPPSSYKREIEQGEIKSLADAPLAVLKAIRQKKSYQFKPDRCMHVKEHSLSGIQNRGWGLPRSIYLLRPSWTLQMIRKQIQALAQDYVVPMRLVHPANQSTPVGGGMMVNPNIDVPIEQFTRQFSQTRAVHRRDPTSMHAFPYPVEYQLLGGEANQLFPETVLQNAKKDLLDAGGFPVEIYEATLSLQAAPVALRLFESVHRAIPWMANQCIQFACDRISELTAMEPIDASHEPVTVTDDLEQVALKLQLGTSGMISQESAFRPLRLDPATEEKRKMQEQIMAMENQRELQERVQKLDTTSQMFTQPAMQDPNAAAAGGDPAAGGAPAPPGAGLVLPSQGYQPPTDALGMDQAATQLAQQLSMMDHMTVQNELRVMRDRHPTFHAIVMQRLEQTRNQQGTMARQQMMAGAM